MSRRDRIEAKLRAFEFPPHSEARLNGRGGLEFRRTDEWTAHYDALKALKALVPWKVIRNHGPTARESVREPCWWRSLQIVLHEKDDGPWAECDVDWFNPDRGLLPLAMHGVVDVGALSLGRLIRRRRENNV